MRGINARTWKKSEDDIVLRIYPNGGAAAVAALLPHRNTHGIKQRACRLGVRSNSVFSHPSGKHVEDFAGVPVHEYTAPDIAMRGWTYPVERAQLRWAA